MALQKQQIAVNFSQGLDTKSDPWQVPIGNFLELQNSVFNKNGLLQKRNGYGQVGSLTDETVTGIATFKGGLTALGKNIYAYNPSNQNFVNKGRIQPLSLNVSSLVNNSLNQTQCDAAFSPNGLVCVVYSELNGGTTTYKYSVLNVETTQNLISPTALTGAGTPVAAPRVFCLGNNFIILFPVQVGGSYYLQYIAVNSISLIANSAVTIETSLAYATTISFDGIVLNSDLHIAWARTGSNVYCTRLKSNLSLTSPTLVTANAATIISSSTDGNSIFVTTYNLPTTSGQVVTLNPNTQNVTASATWVSSGTLLNLATVSKSNVCTIISEVSNTYSYSPNPQTNYLNIVSATLNPALGTITVGSSTVLKRSVGLASKAFICNDTTYVLTVYSSNNQPTYFLLDTTGNVVLRLAYQNARGYLTTGLPSVYVNGTAASFPYLFKNVIQSANKETNVNANTQTSQIYTQTGVNLAQVNLGEQKVNTTEIGNNLNISGGLLWGYDGVSATENNFFLYPDYVTCAWSSTGGSMSAPAATQNTYFYQVTYEWSDNQGNIFRSAPSVPVAVQTTGATSTGSVTINVPNLRLTYKTNVKVVIYRWGVNQQNYYQVTSLTAPIISSTATDSITAFVDTQADSTILGNNLLYTTGNVIENIGTSACTSLTLFDNRLWFVDSENKNVLWYSKQVIQNTPVEMSDLFTIYVSPTQSAQGATGTVRALAPMDDKLCIFKRDAIYYLNGTGPDATGAGTQYSEPIFITSTIGCENQESIVFIPNGLMFQSDKGIWLLGRDLSTTYIGAPVELFTTGAMVVSATAIPGTNQVRFLMDSGITLMYDYFYNQWGTFTNVPGISATLYENLHTYLFKLISNQQTIIRIYQETPGKYLDGGHPVLMHFKTNWFALVGIQGFQRVYFLFLLGRYISPHRLVIGTSYNFNSSIVGQTIITPNNYNLPMGGNITFGQTITWGGVTNVEKWRILLEQQKCDSVQFTITEQFDPAYGAVAGEGLTLSGMNLVVGIKKGYGPVSQFDTVG